MDACSCGNTQQLLVQGGRHPLTQTSKRSHLDHLLALGETARVVAQLGFDHGLHQHVPWSHSVLVAEGVTMLVDMVL